MKQVLIIGGGILGLATGYKLQKKFPDFEITILEKEPFLGIHQTGHNSGVIHSGIYYKPGSLKALNCRKGVNELLTFCDENDIQYEICGKLIVATSKEELPRLDELFRRGVANGVPDLKKISANEIKEIEPYATGISALYSPKTGIIDFVKVAEAYAKRIKKNNGKIIFNEKVIRIRKEKNWYVETQNHQYLADFVINCCGLQADRVAHLANSTISKKQIIPFRGEYYSLVKEKNNWVKGLIYPVPDPQFPFLGVHLSRTLDGSIEAGPNAVLALSREGYTKCSVNFYDCLDYLTYPGFWRMAKKYWKVGLYEWYRSFSKKAFLISLQKLMPELQITDLQPALSGVRSQIVLPNGSLQDDFLFHYEEGLLNVLNAPSPAATASLSIAESIIEQIKFK